VDAASRDALGLHLDHLGKGGRKSTGRLDDLALVGKLLVF
jgi:hypothetical protein